MDSDRKSHYYWRGLCPDPTTRVLLLWTVSCQACKGLSPCHPIPSNAVGLDGLDKKAIKQQHISIIWFCKICKIELSLKKFSVFARERLFPLRGQWYFLMCFGSLFSRAASKMHILKNINMVFVCLFPRFLI